MVSVSCLVSRSLTLLDNRYVCVNRKTLQPSGEKLEILACLLQQHERHQNAYTLLQQAKQREQLSTATVAKQREGGKEVVRAEQRAERVNRKTKKTSKTEVRVVENGFILVIRQS